MIENILQKQPGLLIDDHIRILVHEFHAEPIIFEGWEIACFRFIPSEMEQDAGWFIRYFEFLFCRISILAHQEQWLVANVVQDRSEEHTSELQSRENLVCRLLL